MAKKRIVVDAVRKDKNEENLKEIFTSLGFKFKNLTLIREIKKLNSRELDYKVEFKTKQIVFVFTYDKNKFSRLLDLMPTFLNILEISDPYYDVDPMSIYPEFNNIFKHLSDSINKTALELSTELKNIKNKHQSLKKKYKKLTRSSEENAQRLLECQRKRNELEKKIKNLKGIPDQVLKKELYDWLKARNGEINIKNFAHSKDVSLNRVEQGLDMLISEGYIKKRD